jgi:hypothetical protein
VIRLLAVLAVLGTAVLAGCGTSGYSGPTHPGRLSKSQWISAADDICADAFRRAAALPRPSTSEELVKQLGRLIGIFEDEHAQLKSLVPEPQEQTAVDAVVEAAAVQITLARGLQEVAKTGDPARMSAYSTANAAKAQQAQRVAQQYGLKICGRPGGEPSRIPLATLGAAAGGR